MKKEGNVAMAIGLFNLHIGLIIMALGLYFFLIPSNLAVGGVTGLAMVIQTFVPQIPIGFTMFFLNIILFTLAFFVIGRSFGGKTIYCSFLLALLIGFFELIFPLDGPWVDDLMLNLLFGIGIQGVGMAIIFYQNASTGGTDIVAKIINTYTSMPIGRALFLSDSLITLGAGFAFGPELGLYAFLGILLNGVVIDKVIDKLNEKVHVLIITEKPLDINLFIQQELRRGSTYIDAMGGYSNERKKMISVVITRKEFSKLKRFTDETDQRAFITVTPIDHVTGEGFTLA